MLIPACQWTRTRMGNMEGEIPTRNLKWVCRIVGAKRESIEIRQTIENIHPWVYDILTDLSLQVEHSDSNLVGLDYSKAWNQQLIFSTDHRIYSHWEICIQIMLIVACQWTRTSIGNMEDEIPTRNLKWVCRIVGAKSESINICYIGRSLNKYTRYWICRLTTRIRLRILVNVTVTLMPVLRR